MRVAVVFGGSSVEHEISILTGMQIIASLNKAKYQYIPIYLTKNNVFTIGKDFDKVETFKNNHLKTKEVTFNRQGIKVGLKKISIDAVISAVHGRGLEGGELAGFFEILGIPYTSCEVLGASIAQDKITMKKILAYDMIPTVNFVGFTSEEWKVDRELILNSCNSLNYPLIIKPATLGSSIGIERVNNHEDLDKKILNAFRYDNRVIVEEVITKMREFNCSIINDDITSAIEEVITSNDILTFTDKYEESNSKRIIPADIPEELANEIIILTKKIARIISNKGVIRIDYLYDLNQEKLYVNEINTIPGSLAYYLYEDKGLFFDELLDILIENAIKFKYLKSQKINTFTSNVLNMKGIKK